MEYNDFLNLLEEVCGEEVRKKFHRNSSTLREHGLPILIKRVNQGFIFFLSPEGFDYWDNIHQKMLGYELQEP